LQLKFAQKIFKIAVSIEFRERGFKLVIHVSYKKLFAVNLIQKK